MADMKRLVAIVAVIVLVVGVTALVAVARGPADRPEPGEMAGPPEEEEWMGPADPELAPLLADILILRVIDNAQLTPDQIRRILPLLERLQDEEKAFRGDLKSAFLAQRQQLLVGSPTAEQARQHREAIRARGQQFRAQTEQARAELAKVLSPEQAGALSRLMQPPWSPGAAGERPGAGGERPEAPGPRASSRPGDARLPRLAGHSESSEPLRMLAGFHRRGVTLERIITLLHEKLEAMPKQG
jgi:Spy/CpxP family protein refolding chaperone